MKKIRKALLYFSKTELALWIGSVLAIVVSFCLFDRNSYLTLSASLIGVTSLVFNAKGNLLGQFLMIIFSLLYGAISFKLSYYGEMLTYVGMTMPMAAFALVAWAKNPYNGNKAEVRVNHISQKECSLMCILAVLITLCFYVILDYFNTANIILSTISVTTSFVAVYLTFRRSPYYAIGYAANDIVLIALWLLAAIKDSTYLSVTVCFMAFLVNDIYGFLSWCKMGKRQAENA